MNAPNPLQDPPLVSNVTKATAANGLAGAALTYAAVWAAQQLHIPLELASVGVGAIFAGIGRWAGKLHPNH